MRQRRPQGSSDGGGGERSVAGNDTAVAPFLGALRMKLVGILGYGATALAVFVCLSLVIYVGSKISADGAIDVALHEYYEQHPEELKRRLENAAQDPVLRPVIAQIRAHGAQAAMQYFNDEEILRRFSEKMGGVPDEVWGAEGVSVRLHEAAREGLLAAVRATLKRSNRDGAGSIDIDAADDERGMTPLAYAAAYGHAAVAKELIAAGADARAADRQGNTILHFAAGYGRRELCELLGPRLRKSDAHVVKNHNGQTAADVAKINGHDVEALLRYFED